MIQALLLKIMHYNYCADYQPLDELKLAYIDVLNEKYDCIRNNVPLLMPSLCYHIREKIYLIQIGDKKYRFVPNMVQLEDRGLYSNIEVSNMTEKEFKKYLT